jgi:hypothetical protein
MRVISFTGSIPDFADLIQAARGYLYYKHRGGEAGMGMGKGGREEGIVGGEVSVYTWTVD